MAEPIAEGMLSRMRTTTTQFEGFEIVQVDAFADRPFVGNPAAVCVLDAPADPARPWGSTKIR